MKEQVVRTDYDHLLTESEDGIGLHEIDPIVYERMWRAIRPRDERRTSRFIRHPTDRLDEYRMLALEIQRVTGGRLSQSALESRFAALQYHKDVTQPYLSTNAVIIFGEDLEGGEIVFPEQRSAVACERDRLITFDGRMIWHGVMPIIKGWRVSLTFYIPTYKTEE